LRYVIVSFLLCTTVVIAADAPSFAVAHDVLAEYCHRCHNEKKNKGDLNLERFSNEASVFKHYKVWTKVLEQLELGEMPPEDKDQPSKAEREQLVAYIRDALKRAATANAGDPGHVVLRRLTNAEYDYAIRDLTGQDLKLSQYFPGDAGGGEGFSNTGGVLFVSPVHLQKYLGAARVAAEHASVLPGTGVEFSPGRVGNRSGKMLAGAVEKQFRDWYQKQAAPLIPKDVKSQRIPDYLMACWKYKYRQHFGNKDLNTLAKEAKLNPDFLSNWWNYLNSEHPKSRYLDMDRLPFRALAGPDPKNPAVVPESVKKGLAQINSNREAWYRIQRPQQDVNAETVKTVRVRPGKATVVQLIVTDAGDGNKGDFVRWWNIKYKLKGNKTIDAKAWNEQRLAEAKKGLSGSAGKGPDHKVSGRNKAEWEQIRDQCQAFLNHYGKHFDGKKIEAHKIGVQAPSVIALPVPPDTIEVSAQQQLDWKWQSAGLATYQALLWAGTPPAPLPPNIPGHLIHWLRGSKAKNAFWPHYGVMRTILPDTHDRRLIEVETNFKRNHPHPGVYYLSDEQLTRHLNDNQKQRLKALQADWKAINDPAIRRLNDYLTKYKLTLGKTIPPKHQKQVAKLTAARDAYYKSVDDQIVPKLQRFAARAWRRPLTAEEKAQLRSQYAGFCAKGVKREQAARLVITRILVSPHFLYRTEKAAPSGKEHPVSSLELATRLSFFLWASTPDDALINAAVNGKLSKKDDVNSHVHRMLKDPRARGMATEFFGQWLRFNEFHAHKGVDRGKFPKFTDKVRWSMYEEAVLFCTHIVRQDRPVTELITADYSFLNEPLGWHYAVPELHGDTFVKRKVDKYRRGGLLGMGAVLTSTSYPLRTSPVLRGNWLLEAVLGTPVPPPPQDVPPLGDEPIANGLTVRQRLAKHRENAQCANCHDRIDPLGFALENFDPIGRWRPTDAAGKPIDDTAVLKDGAAFKGPDGLRKYLVSQQDDMLKHMCTKLVGYALGREVVITDQPLVEQMVKNLKAKNYRFSAAVTTIVHSRQFRNRL
jgi:hypothetical protein